MVTNKKLRSKGWEGVGGRGGLGCVNMEGRFRFTEKVIMNNINYCHV